jgi:hypothetical protein
MNRSFCLFALAAILLSAPLKLQGQTLDATVCAILADPQSFDGKMVRIHATVSAGFDEFALKDPSCKQPANAIWLAYPDGTKGKAGPAAIVQLVLAKNSSGQVTGAGRTPVVLDKNKDFKLLDGLLSAPYKGPGRCLGCVRSTVTATLTGRLDGVSSTGLDRDAQGTITAIRGFGNLNRYSARLVLSAVADAAGHEIDYSKAGALPKTDAAEGGGDPVAAAHQAAKAFGAANPIGGQIERAAAAFGGPGEDNGVDVGFGAANEVPKGEAAKTNDSSPDGARYLVTMNMEQLKGNGLSEAIAHTGTHIADIRGGKSGDTLYAFEERAWQVTVFSAIANREKTLTLPGGIIAWNSAWPEADRSKSVNDAVDAYVAEWADLSR